MSAEYLQAYKQQMGNNRQNGNSSDKELIDISSDDDQAKTTTASASKSQSYQRETMDIEHVAKKPHLDHQCNESTTRSMTQMVRKQLFVFI